MRSKQGTLLGLLSSALAFAFTTREDAPFYNSYAKQAKYLNGGAVEYVTFESKFTDENTIGKKIARNGVLYKMPNAKATIVVCHGFMCDKFDIGFLRRMMFPDYNVLMFDFRAHGEHVDEEQCCTFGKYEAYDVAAAVNFLKSCKELEKTPRIAYGFSMGAVAAIQAQASDDTLFNAMILDCPYDKSENVIKRGVEQLKVTLFGYTLSLPGAWLLEKYAFNPTVQTVLKFFLKRIGMDATGKQSFMHPLNPVDSIKQVSIPCFFIHCVNDEKVSVVSAKNVYENAQGYKRFWITKGRRHFDSFFYNPDKYAYKVNQFIKKVVTKEITHTNSAKTLADMPLDNTFKVAQKEGV